MYHQQLAETWEEAIPLLTKFVTDQFLRITEPIVFVSVRNPSCLCVCVSLSLSLSFPTLPPLLQSLPLCGPPQLKELFLAFAYTMQHYNFNIAPLHEYLENIHVHFDKVMLQRTRMMLDAV